MADDTEEEWAWLIREVWATGDAKISALDWRKSLQEPQADAEFQKEIKNCEPRFRRGSKHALFHALFVCIVYCRPLPAWVSKELWLAYCRLRDGQLRSWEDVFGKPFLGKRRKGILTRRKAPFVYAEVCELHEKEGRALDDFLFEDVGKTFRIGTTTAKNLYYEYKRLMQRKK
jgi:hypothetical protein